MQTDDGLPVDDDENPRVWLRAFDSIARAAHRWRMLFIYILEKHSEVIAGAYLGDEGPGGGEGPSYIIL